MLRMSLSFILVRSLASLVAMSVGGWPALGAAAPEPVARARYLMGTVCEVTAYSPEAAPALDAALDEIARLEAILSDYRQDSELSRLNRQPPSVPFPCSPDLYGFLRLAAGYGRETGGAFDITVGPLVKLWDLRGVGRSASQAEVAAALLAVGHARLSIDDAARTATLLAPGMVLDPGALGKGFALDAAARLLRDRGVAAALLDFGGQLLAIGAPPGADGWEVGLAHPLRRDEAAFPIRLKDASLSTSGNSQRSVRVAGLALGHVVDPRTGRPLTTTGSASVIAATGAEADALSTALLVMGPEEGLRWAALRRGVAAAFLDVGPDGSLRVRSTSAFPTLPAQRAQQGPSPGESGDGSGKKP